MPVMTARRGVTGMDKQRPRRSVGSDDVRRPSVARIALREAGTFACLRNSRHMPAHFISDWDRRFSRPSICLISPEKTKFLSPNSCCDRAWSRWAKKISASAVTLPVHKHPAVHRGAFLAHVQDLDLVDQLLAGQHFAMKHRPRDLGQDHLLAKVVDLADQDAARLGQAFQDQGAPASPDSRENARQSDPPPGSGS